MAELQKSMKLGPIRSEYILDYIEPAKKQNCKNYCQNVKVSIYEILNGISIFSDQNG